MSRRPPSYLQTLASKQVVTALKYCSDPVGKKSFILRATHLGYRIRDSLWSRPAFTVSAKQRKTQQQDVALTDLRKAARWPRVIVWDLETTGKGGTSRIVEFAARDCAGGPEAILQSLINPGSSFNLSSWPDIVRDKTGIYPYMVCRPDVPTWLEFMPVLEAWMQARVDLASPECPVLLVAHNGKTFDTMQLVQEYARFGKMIPEDWQFADSLPFFRALGAGASGPIDTKKCNLGDLGRLFKVDTSGHHRAEADCHILATVLQKAMQLYKVPVVRLVDHCYKANIPDEDQMIALQQQIQSISSKEEPSCTVRKRLEVPVAASTLKSASSRPRPEKLLVSRTKPEVDTYLSISDRVGDTSQAPFEKDESALEGYLQRGDAKHSAMEEQVSGLRRAGAVQDLELKNYGLIRGYDEKPSPARSRQFGSSNNAPRSLRKGLSRSSKEAVASFDWESGKLQVPTQNDG